MLQGIRWPGIAVGRCYDRCRLLSCVRFGDVTEFFPPPQPAAIAPAKTENKNNNLARWNLPLCMALISCCRFPVRGCLKSCVACQAS